MTWRHIEVWVEGGTDEEADRLFEAIADAAHDNEPAGTDVHVGASMRCEKPVWA